MFFWQMVASGLVNGAVYALMAAGLVVIYKASSVVNFAHGHVGALAAFVSFTFLNSLGVSWLVAFLAGIFASTFVSFLIEIGCVYPLRKQRPLTIVVQTMSVALILAGLMTLEWGSNPRLHPPIVTGTAFTIFGLSVALYQVVLVAATLATVAVLAVFFKYSTFGISMRAAAENPTVALLLGIDVRKVSIGSWALGGATGGMAAMFVAPQITLAPDAFTLVMVQSFMAIVLAGFTNFLGAVAGGFIIGISLNLFSGYVVTNMPSTFMLVLLLAVLLVRPHGLFGKAEATRL
jgi:branched-chain amino acid transport system permease protein